MAGKNINVGFYITIFEKEINVGYATSSNVILKEGYNFKDLQIAKCDEIEKFQIGDALESARILNLERICSRDRSSRHVVICLSGFLTEDIEKKESWRHAVNHFKHAEIYALNWNSLTAGNVFNDGHYLDKKSKGRYFNILRTGRK